MIDKIIEFSIRNKLIIGLMPIALFFGGIWSMLRIPLDAVPDITNNQVQIITTAPNLGTEDIEKFVTLPIELEMGNLPSVKEIRSISRFGLSLVTIVFEDDFGTYLPRQLVSEKLNDIKDAILEEFGTPYMGPISTGLGEILQYTLEVEEKFKDDYSITELRSIQDWIIKRQMAMVKGVVEVNSFGGKIKQYEVAVNPDELKALNITISEIFTALEENNHNTGGAYIEKNHQAQFIRGKGLMKNKAEIENTVVKNIDDHPILIKDIAIVKFGSSVRYGAVTKNGKGEAVGGMVMMLKGSNSNEVIETVKERIEQIQQSLPEGIKIKPFLDRSNLIERTTGTITFNLIEGGLIVIFILVILLGNWRGGIIVASTIPLSLLFAFIMMNLFGVSANLMSLGAIDFGIIVDGAVIIVESTLLLITKNFIKTKVQNQKTRDELATKSSKKMMNAAFFGQLIILIVFIPILMLEGVEGKMFRPMALTFMFAMIGAMILCLTYVPMMSALIIKIPKKQRFNFGNKMVQKIENVFIPILNRVLKRPIYVVSAALIGLVFSIVLFFRMGGEFIPQLDEGDIAFHVILKPGSSLSESIEKTTQVEKLLLDKFPEILQIVSKIGVADVPTDPMPMDVADVMVSLSPEKYWNSDYNKAEMIELMKAEVMKIPGINYEFSQPIEMRFNELISGVRQDIAIKLFGDDLDILAEKAQEIERLISNVEGIGDKKVEATQGLPQITVEYNRGKLAQYGISIHTLNEYIQSSFGGGVAGSIYEGEKRFDLVVRFDSLHRDNIENIKNLYVKLPNEHQIPISELASIQYESAPMQISRDNTSRRISIGINVRNRDIASVVKDIQNILDEKLELPPGYYIRYGGTFENLERATNKMKWLVPLALFLIFVMIFFALKSLAQTLIIYISIPLAAVGGVLSLWIRDMPFSISAGIGFIVLFGVVVLNGLVLITSINDLKDQDMSIKDRILKGTKERIRPILLTALTDVLGFLPMAISSSSGAEVQRPLATVVIGGLVTASFLTLFIIPVLYQWVEKRKGKKMQMIAVIAPLLFIFSLPSESNAQTHYINVTLEDFKQQTIERYNMLKADSLQIESNKALIGTRFSMGSTTVFTGGEEIGFNNPGVYTLVGLQFNNINLFQIKSKKNVIEAIVGKAKAQYDLDKKKLEADLVSAYAKNWFAQKKKELYKQIDTLWNRLQKNAELGLQYQSISELEALRIENFNTQTNLNYNWYLQLDKMSELLMNYYYQTDTDSIKADAKDTSWMQTYIVETLPSDISNHPLLNQYKQRKAYYEAQSKANKAQLYPSFNAQYGIQKIGTEIGYHAYQFGINIPLFYGAQKSKAHANTILSEAAQEQYIHQERTLQQQIENVKLEYLQKKMEYEYYRNKMLPLAQKQMDAALKAYEEGELNYASFSQSYQEALTYKIKGLEAWEELINLGIQLQYFQSNN